MIPRNSFGQNFQRPIANPIQRQPGLYDSMNPGQVQAGPQDPVANPIQAQPPIARGPGDGWPPQPGPQPMPPIARGPGDGFPPNPQPPWGGQPPMWPGPPGGLPGQGQQPNAYAQFLQRRGPMWPGMMQQ